MTKSFICFTMLVLYSYSASVIAQNNKLYKNELGIDIANVVTFLSKKQESCLINYKRHFSEKSAFRSGLNLDWSNASDGYKSVGIRGGYERSLPVTNSQWRLYFGSDASFTYLARNYMPNSFIRYGLSPLIGFSYFPVQQFSVSTEAGINFQYTDYRNPGSIVPQDNENVFGVNVGYVGMVVVAYHF